MTLRAAVSLIYALSYPCDGDELDLAARSCVLRNWAHMFAHAASHPISEVACGTSNGRSSLCTTRVYTGQAANRLDGRQVGRERQRQPKRSERLETACRFDAERDTWDRARGAERSCSAGHSGGCVERVPGCVYKVSQEWLIDS